MLVGVTPKTGGFLPKRNPGTKEQSIVSYETQEAEIRSYYESIGLKLDERDIFRIIESAKNSDDRKNYAAAINSALARGIRHVLFSMYDGQKKASSSGHRRIIGK